MPNRTLSWASARRDRESPRLITPLWGSDFRLTLATKTAAHRFRRIREIHEPSKHSGKLRKIREARL